VADGNLTLFLQQLRQVVYTRGVIGEIPDRALVERFVKDRDEAAFEVLLWRHGPMVLSLCQRMLHNAHDAEDAFQAAFFILARKASTIGKRQSFGSWLYKVAYRCALRAKTRAVVRAGKETALIENMSVPDPAAQAAWQELRLTLDDVVQELPEKYRTVIVLHYLEGRTSQQIAGELHCPVGTVTSRLTRARELLRHRIARRGLTLSAAMIGAALAEGSAVAAAPRGLVFVTLHVAKMAAAGQAAASTVPTRVLTLAQGVTRDMFLRKLKIAAVLFLSIACLGAGMLTYGANAEPDNSATQQGTPPGAIQAGGGKEAAEPNELFAKAATAVKAVPDAAQKAYALMVLAQAQAAAGDRPAAAKTLRQGVVTAQLIQHNDEYPKRATLSHLAKVQAEVGAVADALKTAAEIEQNLCGWAFAHIASAQAKAGDAKGALETVGRIPESDQGLALMLIATCRLEARNLKTALQTAEKIKKTMYKVEALSLIAAAQAKAGQRDAALKTLETAQAITKECKDGNADFALVHIGKAYAELGDRKAAVKIAESFQDFKYDWVMAHVARVAIRAGKIDDALQILDGVSDKNDVLVEIVAEQIKAHNLDGARKTIDGMPRAYLKTDALSQLAAAQMAAGDAAGAAKAYREVMKMVTAADPSTLFDEQGSMCAGPLRLHSILVARAEAGDAKGALAWGEAQDSAFLRSVTLAAVAEGLARRKAADKRSPEKK
jgi:RNA polymerase sigma factor (sigma-70 family)